MRHKERRALELAHIRTSSFVDLYREGLLCREVGERLGCSEEYVRRRLVEAGEPRRKKGTGSRPREANRFYRRGYTIDKSGYRLVADPERRGKYVREHRLVMEQHLGRKLLPTEVVHHRNGDRQDNRIENLELYGANADHLREELTGRCPKWTEEGKQRIQEALIQGRAIWRAANHRASGTDGPPSR